MAMQNPFTNLGQTFQTQQQQAGLAQLMTDEQFKQIQALNDPTKNLAMAKQVADAQAAYPQLQTNVQAVGMGEGVMKGLSNAINNGRQISAHNQQVKAYQDIQSQYQAAQAQQRELAMGQIQADVTRRQTAGGLLPKEIQPIYGVSTPDQQNALITKQAGLEYIPLEAKVKEVGEQGVRGLKRVEFGNINLNSGQLSSADRERYHQIYGHYPEDLTTQRERTAELKTKEDKAYMGGIDADNYATEKTLALQASTLANQLNQIKLQAEPLEIESRLADARQRRMISGTQFEQAQQAIQMWDGLLQRMQNGDMPSQGEMAIFTAGMKVLAGQVPELDKSFTSAMNLKTGQKPSDADWAKFFGGSGGRNSPATAMPGLSIQPKATQGSLVQNPNDGKWYDLNKRDANGIPIAVPAPSNAPVATPKPASPIKPAQPAKPAYHTEKIGSGSYKVPNQGNREKAQKDPYLNAITPKDGAAVRGLTSSEAHEYRSLLSEYKKSHRPDQYSLTTGDYAVNPLDAFFHNVGTTGQKRLEILHKKHMGAK